jgi:two-component system OmpR family response regulator
MKILIIEDEEHVANLLADAVKFQGHDAVVAIDGQKGLALLERELPDAVFLDIVMPAPNGIEVLRRIRERWRELPVVVISGGASAGQIKEAKRLGVSDCVEKPLMLNQITEAITALRKSGDQEGR